MGLFDFLLSRGMRDLRHAAPVRIGDCTDGQIAVFFGVTRACRQPFIAPFAGTPCVAYSIFHCGYKGGSVVADEQADFVLDDGTGTAVVDALCAELHFVSQTLRSLDATTPRAPALQAFAERTEWTPPSVGTSWYQESVLPEGARVIVFGQARWTDAPADVPAGPYGAARLLRITAPEGHLVVIDGDPSDVASVWPK